MTSCAAPPHDACDRIHGGGEREEEEEEVERTGVSLDSLYTVLKHSLKNCERRESF